MGVGKERAGEGKEGGQRANSPATFSGQVTSCWLRGEMQTWGPAVSSRL